MQTPQAAGATKTKGPRNGAKIAFLFILWIFLAGILLQVLLIGLGLFYDARFLAAHADVGWILHLYFLPMIVGFFGRLGRTLVIVNIVAIVLLAILPILATFRDSAIGGLHPLTAVTIFGLALYLAIKVRAITPRPWGSAASPSAKTPPPAPTMSRAPAQPPQRMMNR